PFVGVHILMTVPGPRGLSARGIVVTTFAIITSVSPTGESFNVVLRLESMCMSPPLSRKLVPMVVTSTLPSFWHFQLPVCALKVPSLRKKSKDELWYQ